MNGEMSSLFSCVFMLLFVNTYTYMRTHLHFKYYTSITLIWRRVIWVYAYICSMVKGRVRTLNHATFVCLRIRAYTAHGHGAGDRMRPLAP